MWFFLLCCSIYLYLRLGFNLLFSLFLSFFRLHILSVSLPHQHPPVGVYESAYPARTVPCSQCTSQPIQPCSRPIWLDLQRYDRHLPLDLAAFCSWTPGGMIPIPLRSWTPSGMIHIPFDLFLSPNIVGHDCAFSLFWFCLSGRVASSLEWMQGSLRVVSMWSPPASSGMSVFPSCTSQHL